MFYPNSGTKLRDPYHLNHVIHRLGVVHINSLQRNNYLTVNHFLHQTEKKIRIERRRTRKDLHRDAD